MREVVDAARAVLSIQRQPEWGSMAARDWDSEVWQADIRKIEQELGWRPRYSFEQGFAQTVQWFKTNPRVLDVYRERSPGNTCR